MSKPTVRISTISTESRPRVSIVSSNISDVEEIFRKRSSLLTSTSKQEGLSRLQAATFSAVLHESLDKIKILGLIGGLPSIKVNLEYQSLVNKYEKEDTQSFIFDPDTLEPYEGSMKKQMLIKFQKDRSYIEQVLQEVNDELISHCSTELFMRRLAEYKLADDERENLLSENFENISTVKQLSLHLENDKSVLSEVLYKKSEELGQLKDEYEDLIYESNIKYRYIDEWESARCIQNELENLKKEDYYVNIIKEYRNNYEKENRVNAEIETYLAETESANLVDIEMWMERYDKDIEAKDLDIQDLREKLDEQTSQLQELTKLYEDHKQEIEDYLIVKEERLKQEKILKEKNRAATIIQAWWRGTMYRKHLGPYRKKKGKKGKGGSGKKKKK